MRRRHSPMPIGLIPGFLSRAMRRFDSSARMSVQSMMLFHNRRARAATSSRSFSLEGPWCKRKSCHFVESVPLGPAPPRILKKDFFQMAITFDPVLTLCWNLNSVDKFSSSLTKKNFIKIGWVGKKLDGGGALQKSIFEWQAPIRSRLCTGSSFGPYINP